MGRLPGGRQVGFASQKHTLYQQCLDQGLQREEIVVFCIEPQETETEAAMPLFIDRLPFHQWTDPTRTPDVATP